MTQNPDLPLINFHVARSVRITVQYNRGGGMECGEGSNDPPHALPRSLLRAQSGQMHHAWSTGTTEIDTQPGATIRHYLLLLATSAGVGRPELSRLFSLGTIPTVWLSQNRLSSVKVSSD